MTALHYLPAIAAGACAGWLLADRGEAPAPPPTSAAEKRNAAFSPHAAATKTTGAPGAEEQAPNDATALADAQFNAAEALIDRIAAAGMEDLPALFAETAANAEAVSHSLARRALMQRWVELDPAGGMEWLKKHGEEETRDLLAAWLRTDTAAAMAWTQQHPDADPGIELTFSASAEELAAVFKAGTPQIRSGIRLDLLQQLDPALAQEVWRAVPKKDGQWRSGYASQLARGMASLDPAAALTWLRSQELGSLKEVLDQCAREHPEFVIKELATCGLPESELAKLRCTVAIGLAAKSPQTLMAWLSEQPDSSLESQRNLPPLAIAVGTMPMGEIHALMQEMSRIGIGLPNMGNCWDWAGRDPAQELLQTATLPEGELRTKMAKSLVDAAVISGRLPRPEEVAALPEDVRKGAVRLFVYHTEATGDQQGTAAWMRLLSADSYGKLFTSLPPGSFAGDLQKFSMLYQQLPPAQQEAALAGFANSFASSDPQQALAWTETLPPEQQPKMWESLAEGLVRQDEAAASEWVQTLPDDASRDGAAEALARGIAKHDPEAALAWALTIHDDTARRGSLNTVVRAWMADEPDAAVPAILAAGLTEEQVPGLSLILEMKSPPSP